MPASQISFAAFALSQQLAIDCTPPAQPLPGPSMDAGLVTQPSVGGGECIRINGVVRGNWGCSSELRDDFYDDLAQAGIASVGAVFGAGMDAPDYLPSGSHTTLVCGAAYAWRYAILDGLGVSRGPL